MAATARARNTGTRSPRRAGPGTLPPTGPVTGPEPSGPLRFFSAADEQEEREEIFSVDGVPYTIPVDPPASIALEALHIMARGGGSPGAAMMAEDYILTEMLGEEGYAALRGCKTIKKHDLRYVITVISERANAAMEDEDRPNR